MEEKLNFEKLGGPVFVGRANGLAARKRAKIDKLDGWERTVEVIIPDDTYSVNSSFFLGMFGSSMIRFGSKEHFNAHYHFRAPERVLKNLWSVLDTVYKSRGAIALDE